MKIAINIWLLRKKELDGIGVFIKETISRLIGNNPDVEFILLCDKNFTEDYFDFPNVQKYFIFPPYRHPVLYIIYMELVLPLFLMRKKPDLLIAPEGMCSLLSSCKQLACVHDLNFVHQPQNLDIKNRLYYRSFSLKHIKKASRIAAVSQYTKDDIIRTCHVDASKIDVTYLGVKEFLPISEGDKTTVRTEYTDGKPYFFFVGSLHPRKNIVRLMRAFDLFKKETGSESKLLLAGSFMWDSSEIKDLKTQLQYHGDILFPGRVSDFELNRLYAAAECLTFVPTFEGFGLPIVEAFAVDTPVICSNVTSMPEIAGDAALLIDPYDIDSIRWAMQQVHYNSNGIKEALIAKGRTRKEIFSWENTAKLLWASVVRCINDSHHF